MADMVSEVTRYPAIHTVLTGGEPLLADGIEALARELKRVGRHITIETAATVVKPVVADLMSISPKLANSTPTKRSGGKFAAMHEKQRLNIPAIQDLIDQYDYQLKFVVERRQDLEEIDSILAQLRNVAIPQVLIMAQGTTKEQLRRKTPWIIELCKARGFRYTPRLHIEWYGNRRGI